MNLFLMIILAVLFVVIAPIIGILITGSDRIITARIQRRVGPPLLQPYYDIRKLFEKEKVAVRTTQGFFVFVSLLMMIFTGIILFIGGDILLVVFALTLSDILLILGAFSSYSPYAHVGAQRELLMLMAVEPMIIIASVGFYEVYGTFYVSEMLGSSSLAVLMIPGVLIGFVYILTFKLRKSPFDISTSHHAHQELVKGLTTEFAGPILGTVEILHLYELVILLGMLYLFFAASPILGVVAIILIYLLEIIVDNATSRVKWQLAFKSAWLVTLVAGAGNIILLSML